MSSHLRNYLLNIYEIKKSVPHYQNIDPYYPIQIDDQDDNDKLNEFCTIFCTITGKNRFRIDLTGTFPVSQAITDLAEIYNGCYYEDQGRLTLELKVQQVEALMDLANRIRKTSFSGDSVNNPNWLSHSARTISSLYRFVRTINEYQQFFKKKNLPILPKQ